MGRIAWCSNTATTCCPAAFLIELYGDYPEHDVILFLALYPTVPSQILEDLTEAYPEPDILAAAAVNPRCTHLLLIRMAREGGAPVRAALAANKQQNAKITASLLKRCQSFCSYRARRKCGHWPQL